MSHKNLIFINTAVKTRNLATYVARVLTARMQVDFAGSALKNYLHIWRYLSSWIDAVWSGIGIPTFQRLQVVTSQQAAAFVVTSLRTSCSCSYVRFGLYVSEKLMPSSWKRKLMVPWQCMHQTPPKFWYMFTSPQYVTSFSVDVATLKLEQTMSVGPGGKFYRPHSLIHNPEGPCRPMPAQPPAVWGDRSWWSEKVEMKQATVILLTNLCA
jgi:hypothetical protein